MPEMQEDRPTDQRNPALDEFVENVAKVNDGLSGVMAAALRMQMLMLDDARNMMTELNAAAARGDNGSDV